MKNIAVIALENALDEVIQQKNIAVRDAAKPFDNKIAELRAAIAKLQNNDIDSENSIAEHLTLTYKYPTAKRGRKPKFINSLIYPTKGTILSKLLYVIREAGRFVTIREIASSVKVYEPNINEDVIKERFGKHIDKFKRARKIVSYRIGSRRNVLYGLPEWMKDDKVIPGREHNPEALIDPVEDFPKDDIVNWGGEKSDISFNRKLELPDITAPFKVANEVKKATDALYKYLKNK